MDESVDGLQAAERGRDLLLVGDVAALAPAERDDLPIACPQLAHHLAADAPRAARDDRGLRHRVAASRAAS